MPQLHTTADHHGLLLYPYQNQILLRFQDGIQFLPPKVLVRDYKTGLTETEFNSTLYYSYLDETGNLWVRSLIPEVFPYKLTPSPDTNLSPAGLYTLKGHLVLLYCSTLCSEPLPANSSTNGSANGSTHLSANGSAALESTISCILPYENTTCIANWKMDSPSGSQVPPRWLPGDGVRCSFSACSLGDGVIVSFFVHGKPVYYILTEELTVKELVSQGLSQITQRQLEDKSKQLEGKSKQLEDKSSQLETCTRQLEDKSKQLQAKEKEAAYYKTQLQSAIKQYNDLMKVAEKYKEVATQNTTFAP